MNNKIVGAILLSAAGLVTAVGVIGAQIASAVVLGQFYVARRDGFVPPGPESATLHWTILIAVAVLAGTASYFFFVDRKSD